MLLTYVLAFLPPLDAIPRTKLGLFIIKILIRDSLKRSSFISVLSNLQTIDMSKYLLKDQIVSAKPAEVDFKVDLYDPEIRDIAKPMDESQFEAFQHALQHRVAIIQGPPGKEFYSPCCGLYPLHT